MNTELYAKWIQSHQVQENEVDLADAVMARIDRKVHKPNMFEQTWQGVLQDMMQTKILVRAGVLASGALMGLLRMAFQVYSVLFT